jgi:hypothetical protein
LKDGDSRDLVLIAKEAGIKEKRTLTRSKRFMEFYRGSIKAWDANQQAHEAMGLGRPVAMPKRGRTISQDTEPATWDAKPSEGDDWGSFRFDDRGYHMPDDDAE